MVDGVQFVTGRRSPVTGRWSPVTGRRSPVTGRWSPVTGHWSLVRGLPKSANAAVLLGLVCYNSCLL